jgi:hypothetical protein
VPCTPAAQARVRLSVGRLILEVRINVCILDVVYSSVGFSFVLA